MLDSSQSLFASSKNFTIRFVQNWLACYKKYVEIFQKLDIFTIDFTHSAFSGVSPYGITKFFPRYKGNTTTRVVFVSSILPRGFL